ncbi:hypothetical protein [Glycomyces paridis]|uniref:Uncharacterized protein n=1 Tax=Glycomyces paridis TaxID=2126555 RepID=A0A4S8PF84_9ACTN|nr:hypothetical protein [Glycomyces paridis]THV29060.1 hypothetical protein E9998_09960 [Glycomyces paridis]
MGNETGEGAEDWEARLGWAFGLIDEDPGVRAAAIEHLERTQETTHRALERGNEALRASYDLTEPQWEEARPAYLAVWRAYRDTQRYTLPGAMWNRPRREAAIKDWAGLPYALLFLEWELAYPAEWTRHAKAWGTKERLLRDLAVPGHAEPVRAKLVEFTDAAVRRAYRCKDREYVRVARAVDGPDLRKRLADAADSDSPWARLHAGYVLHLLDHPALPNSRKVWLAWCEGEPPCPR